MSLDQIGSRMCKLFHLSHLSQDRDLVNDGTWYIKSALHQQHLYHCVGRKNTATTKNVAEE